MANGSAHLPCYLDKSGSGKWTPGQLFQVARANQEPIDNLSRSNAQGFFLAGISSALVWRCGYVALWLCSYVCNCMEMLLCGNKIICVPTTCLRIRPTKTSYIFSTALTNFSKTVERSAHNCLPLLRSK
jgi:hypothetical protein